MLNVQAPTSTLLATSLIVLAAVADYAAPSLCVLSLRTRIAQGLESILLPTGFNTDCSGARPCGAVVVSSARRTVTED